MVKIIAQEALNATEVVHDAEDNFSQPFHLEQQKMARPGGVISSDATT